MTTFATPATVPSAVSAAEAGVAAVHRYYQLVDAGDVAGLVALFTPSASYHRPGYAPMVGHAAMTAFYSGARVIREGAHTVTTAVAAGDQVAVHGRFAGTLHTGEEVALRFADFFHLAPDTRFTRRDTFFFAPLV
ncbi:nuclear transport factor 2 family protein [Actinokineospora guangxiensis]|uniref:Nuclear transport factor 2 family protein n=1 Tax=Actinokineospora guangxiensis TaxID=1490288 RepID=A0ABW0EKU7_9PSEU